MSDQELVETIRKYLCELAGDKEARRVVSTTLTLCVYLLKKSGTGDDDIVRYVRDTASALSAADMADAFCAN